MDKNLKILSILLFLAINCFGQITIPNNGMFYQSISSAGNGLLNGLISVWELDETTGTIAYDSYGSNDATNINCTINQSGKIGTSYLFNSNTDAVVCGDIDLASNSSMTITYWVYYVAIQGSGVNKYDYGTGNRSYIAGGYGTNARFVVSTDGTFNSTSIKDYRGNSTLTTGSWIHMCFTFDSGDTRIYVNGIEDTPYTKSADGSITTIYQSNVDMRAGAYLNNGVPTGTGFSGYVDQIAIWDRALSATEIASLYNSGNGLAYIDFTAYLKLKNKQLWQQFYYNEEIQTPLRIAS